MKVFVNATAAKCGGAETILRSFVSWVGSFDTQNEYIVFSGVRLVGLPSNVKCYYFPTGGFFTLFFSLFLSYILAKFFSARVLVSFSNVNSVFGFGISRLTYFHQFKIFSDSSIRMKILRWILLHQTQVVYVCQSEFVATHLRRLIGSVSRIGVSWPGLYLSGEANTSYWNDERFNAIVGDAKYIGICPVADVGAAHKGFDDLYRNAAALKDFGFVVLVTADASGYQDNDVFKFIGRQKFGDLCALYERVGFLFYPSKLETVGLPIIEGLYFKLKLCLRDCEYSRSLEAEHGLQSVFSYWPVSRGSIDFEFDKPFAQDVGNVFLPNWGSMIALYTECSR